MLLVHLMSTFQEVINMSGNNPIAPELFLAKIAIPQVQNEEVKLADLDSRGLLVEVTLERPQKTTQSIEVLYNEFKTAPQDLVAGQKASYFIPKDFLAKHVGEKKKVVVSPGPTNPSAHQFTIRE